MLTSRDLFALLALLLALVVALVQRRRGKVNRNSPPTTPPTNSNPEPRATPTKIGVLEASHWTPVDFAYPPVTPVTEALDQIAPRPYRPYKPGRYHVTMGARPMDWDAWIELDRDFPAYYRLRAARLASPRGPKLFGTVPHRPNVVRGGVDAARELVQELAEFLVARYPGVYRATRRGGEIVAVEVLPVGVTHDLEAEDPVMVAALLSQDDIGIMIEGTDGQYYLQGGAVLLSGSWRLEDKVGLPLDAIHTSGHVPQCTRKNFSRRSRLSSGDFSPNSPVQRNNWLIQVLPPTSTQETAPHLEELAWAEGTYGPEDTYGTVPRPPPPKPEPERIRLRVERQTLRRLPRSGAIILTIHSYLTPLTELGPGEAGRLAAAIRGVKGQDVVYRHRRQSNFEDVVLEWLDGQHRDEVRRGIAQE